jgi:DNA-binding MarR family transcriptional regulator
MARRPAVTEPDDETGEFPLHPAIYFLHLTHAISRFREARLDSVLRNQGLDLAGFRALRALRRFGSATMGELADFTMIDRTTLTRVVDQLVEDGLIGRSKFEGDRRKVVLKLTPEGRKAFVKARSVAADTVVDLMSGLPEADVRAAVRLQVKIVERLGAPDPVARRLLWLEPEKRRRARRAGEAAGPEADQPVDS